MPRSRETAAAGRSQREVGSRPVPGLTESSLLPVAQLTLIGFSVLCRIKKAFASIKLQRGETHNCKIKKNELNAATESLSKQNPEGMQLLFSRSVVSDSL